MKNPFKIEAILMIVIPIVILIVALLVPMFL
jgi:hypothetical protein